MKTRFGICALALVSVAGCGGGSSGGNVTTMSADIAPGNSASCIEGADKGANAVLKTLVGAGISARLQGCIQIPGSGQFFGETLAIYAIPDADVPTAEKMCMERIDLSRYTDFPVAACP